MFFPTRHNVLSANAAMRQGTSPKARRLSGGEVAFRIPEQDWPVLMRLVPELKHPDAEIRRDAWEKFRHSPLGEPYLVVRTPGQVRRSKTRIVTP